MRVCAAACLLSLLFVAAPADAVTLRVTYDVADLPIQPGDTIDIFLEMSDLNGEEAAGFQAFFVFNNSEMFLVGGQYSPAPFGLAILPIVATGNEIDLAAGINTFAGQPPTSSDAVLAHLTFQATAEFCVPTVVFRTNAPPTRVTDPVGDPLTPLELKSLKPSGCPADIYPADGGDGVVNVFDLLLLLQFWGAPVPSVADFNCDGVVNVFDLLFLLDEWGPCT